MLIEEGANIDIKNKQEATALILTIQEKRIEICEMLIEAGCKVN